MLSGMSFLLEKPCYHLIVSKKAPSCNTIKEATICYYMRVTQTTTKKQLTNFQYLRTRNGLVRAKENTIPRSRKYYLYVYEDKMENAVESCKIF